MGSVVSKIKILHIAIKQVLELFTAHERVQRRIEADPGLPVPNPTLSFWHNVPAPIHSYRPERLPDFADVVIIGSGITGVSIARTLCRETNGQLKVFMLDARDTCSGASGRNGGHIKPPLHHEYLSLKRKHGIEQAKKLMRFRMLHIHEIMMVAKDEGIIDLCQAREVNSLDVYYTQSVFQEAKVFLQSWKQDMPEEAKDYTAIEGSEAIEKFCLSSDVVGVVCNTAGAIHPYRFVTGILGRLLEQYADSFGLSTNTPCTEILASQKGAQSPLYTVVTPRGRISTPHVVHATNAWCSHLLPSFRKKVFAMRGNMTAQRPGDNLSPSSLDGGRSWVFYDQHIGYDYLTQLPDGECELMFGGGFMQGGEVGLAEIGNADDSHINRRIIAHLSGSLPLLFGSQNWGHEARPVREKYKRNEGDTHENGSYALWSEGRLKAMWSGIIGMSVDGIPWVGRVPPHLAVRQTLSPPYSQVSTKGLSEVKHMKTAAPGEWLAAGYSGEGMVHAFLSGRAVAYQILDREAKITAWFPECMYIKERRWETARAEDFLENF